MAGTAWHFVLLLVVLFSSYSLCEDASTEEKPQAEEVKEAESTEDVVIEEDGGVLILTEKNFDKVLKENSIILVEFYAPWCGHCKQLAPEYSKAALTLKTSTPPVPLGKVDCTVEKELGNRFDVQGYPTLKLFKDGVPADYDGPREEKGIVNYMKERSDPNWKPPPEAVITLTKDNFDELTQQEDLMLVEFYAPWCGHCKKLAPFLEKAAQSLKTQENPILIGKVDATIESELGTKYGVTGYPTMKVFRKGKISEYKGPREEPGISEYMNNQAGLPTKLQESLAIVKKFMKSNLDEPVFLGVFDNEEDEFFKLFVEANNDLRDDYVFGHTFDAAVKTFFKLKQSAIVIIHPEHLVSKHEKRYQMFTDVSGSPSEVQEFYKKHHVPLVGHMQQHTEKRFAKRPLVVVYYDVNFDLEYRSITQFWRNKVLAVAKENPDMLFAVADETGFESKLKELGLSESGEDVNVGIYDANGYRYALVDEEFNDETLEEFIEEFKKGKVKPTIKSQAPVARGKPGKVQVVTGKTFDDIVKDETKEVFIEFYAPWCGHCKAIEGHMVDLAKKFTNEKDIIIAKIDGTANEGPSQYPVSGFPTIYYAKPGQKDKPIALSGKRDLEGLVKFVEDNSDILKKKEEKIVEKEEL